MALKIVQGDLFANLSPPTVIVHGCNCQGVMGSGFAAKLLERFPDAKKVYLTAKAAHGLKLGDFNGYSDTDGYTIINALTQEFYGRIPGRVYVSYAAVEKALSGVSRWVLSAGGNEEYPIRLPLIGGGLANGDKDTLIGIFERVFEGNNATLYIN